MLVSQWGVSKNPKQMKFDFALWTRRALEQNVEAVRHWKQAQYPDIARRAKEERALIKREDGARTAVRAPFWVWCEADNGAASDYALGAFSSSSPSSSSSSMSSPRRSSSSYVRNGMRAGQAMSSSSLSAESAAGPRRAEFTA